MRHRVVAACCLAALGCARSVTVATDAAGHDATAVDERVADAAVDAPAIDIADVPPVETCSGVTLRGVSASPPGGAVAYPGSRLVVQGTGLLGVLHVTVGGIEQPFDPPREDSVVTRVPPMLPAGTQVVTVTTARCTASTTVSVSRLAAWIPRTGGHVTFFDFEGLVSAAAMDTGLARIVRAAFTNDGTTLILQDADGRVLAQPAWDTISTSLATGATAPFAIAGGTVVPTSVLVATGAADAARSLLRVDTSDSVGVSPLGGDRSAIGVAAPLDGSRALVLDTTGAVTAVDLPFSSNVQHSPLLSSFIATHPTEIAEAQAGAGTAHGPFAAVYEATSTPSVIAFDAMSGAVVGRASMPSAAGGLTFLSGDVVALSAHTPELLTIDIGIAGAAPWRDPLLGEPLGPPMHTQFSATLYRVGVVALRDATAEGDTVHVFDFHREPAVEERQVAIPGVRGVVGVQGDGDPFLAWTAADIIRLRGIDGSIARRVTVDASYGEGGLVVVSR